MTLISPAQQAAAGWDIFPLLPNRKTDYAHVLPEGSPRGESDYWHSDMGAFVRPTRWVNGWERLDELGIATYWPHGDCRSHNVGIATGHRSGVWVLDVDMAFDTETEAREYAEEYVGVEIPQTLSVRTASGKWHFYYKMPENRSIEVKSTVSKLGPQIDVRGDGGMAMGIGSSVVNESGERGFYEIVTMMEPIFAPVELLDRVKREHIERDEFAIASAEKDVNIAADALAQGWIEEELQKLRDLRRPWEPGSGWHMACFEVACQVLEFANSPWCATTPTEMFERYKAAAPPPDGSGWNPLTEWREALKKTEGKGRAKPRVAESMEWFDQIRPNPTEPQGQQLQPPAPGEILPAPRDWQQTIELAQGSDGTFPLASAIRSIVPALDGYRVLASHDDGWYFYEGSYWAECAPTEISDFVSRQIAPVKIRTMDEGKAKISDLKPGMGKVRDVEQALATLLRRYDEAETDGDLTVYTRNGALTVSGQTYRHAPASPAVFNLSALPFSYDPIATCPNWEAFLADLFEHDPSAIMALQEWFGYFLVGRPGWLQKMFWLIGPKRSGKGTILNVARSLMGEAATATSLTMLSKDFGRENLIGKRLVIIDDARDPDPRVAHGVVEFLLTLSSGGFTTVARKHRRNWDGVLSTAFFAASNTIPRLPDDGNAISSRVEVIQTTKSFYGHEDPHVAERLQAELPGILNWALAGLDRLRLTERFTQAGASQKVRDEVGRGATGATPAVRDLLMPAPIEGVGVSKKDIGIAIKWWFSQQEDSWSPTAPAIRTAIRAEFPYAEGGEQRARDMDGRPLRSNWRGILIRCRECDKHAVTVSQITGPECRDHMTALKGIQSTDWSAQISSN